MAGVGIAAVWATWKRDKDNGTVSSLGDYTQNAFTASAEVGAAFVGIGTHVGVACSRFDFYPKLNFPVKRCGNVCPSGKAIGSTDW